jgi:hypothetical protein
MKSPPFKKRALAFLEAARAIGAASVRIKDRDGASFECDLKSEALDQTDERNDFDVKPPRRGKQ